MNQLKEVRETSFLSFEEIAEQIHIPVACLQAIEKEDYTEFPEKEFMIERYIRSYANFLEVDPKPILDSYRKAKLTNRLQSSTTLPTRGKKRKAQKPTASVSFLYTYRYYLLASAIALSLAMITWMMIPSDQSDSESVSHQEQTKSPIENQNRPVFALQSSSKTFPSSETWFVSHVETFHVNLQATGTVNVRIRENGPKGTILLEKKLSKGKSIDLKGEKWISIYLDKPNLTLLKVNDVVIDTTNQKNSYFYEFKVVSN